MTGPARIQSKTKGHGGDREYLRDFRSLSVSVVIVNFNTGPLLTDVVRTVLTQTLPPLECIIVDNASTDGSIDHLRGEIDDDRVVVLQMETNLGFASGCNRGITESTGTQILLLNPDCFLEPDTLELLLAELSANDAAGAAGPLILNMDGTEQRGCRREIPTPWQIFCVGVGLHRMMPRHPRFRSFNSTGEELPDKTVRVQSISGSCMLIPRRVVNLVGLLDERYFMHFEDLDWCMRVGAAGQCVLFVPNAIAHHVGGVSGRDRAYRVEMHKHTSLIRFVRANFAQYYPSAFIVLVSFVVYARWLTLVLRMATWGKSRNRNGWYSLFVDADEDGAGGVDPQRD
ncbi:MAG: dTDP-Rha--alpha-D-GlcNAc-pyrophosphate polyprenol alpha-3-L-rhamnosyltransferase [Alphaproteobacteria bacterium]|nr:dTDP-Rha--alpha-D-GlcNAc-pyrophosphate polyprenol alpha-3-L-rhamnosyltransferase [Alphaproteobacteria bacterium]|tara:strand:- start:1116 stop:2144 length:1029 start_codon:yes stop_codon:yes gene_type:complete